MEDIFTVTCSGTGTLVKDFESWSHPWDSSNGIRGPCTGQSPWYDLSQATQTRESEEIFVNYVCGSI